MKPKRPELLKFASLSELYQHFETLFLNGQASSYECVSACGHAMKIFDHHFFHMVKLGHRDKPERLLMANEKETILATTAGFGPYTYDRQRAIYLASAAVCLVHPDEVWEDPILNTAKWVYLKQFDAIPYAFTILLVGEREVGKVPVTSFPGKNRDARKWRRGTRIYP